MLGMLLGALLMLGVSWICFRQTPRRVDKWFRRLQLVSSAAYSLGHGGNDAQKTMGIIWLLLIADGRHDQGSPAQLGGGRAASSRSASARCSAAGASSRPWASASPS